MTSPSPRPERPTPPTGTGSGAGTGAGAGPGGGGGPGSGGGTGPGGGPGSGGGTGPGGGPGSGGGTGPGGGPRPGGGPGSGPEQPQYADRAYRSMAGMVGGAGLLVVACWLGSDGIANGKGHTPWFALAGLLLALPLIVALTLRPAVFANSERVRVRNPFRTITVPWAGVDAVRSSYSTELLAGGKKYQLWAIPVSLRARKRAARQDAKAKAAGDDAYMPGGRRPAYGRTPRPVPGADPTIRAWSDQALSELRELAEAREPSSSEESTVPVVRWCWEVLAPAAAGAVVLIVLLAL